MERELCKIHREKKQILGRFFFKKINWIRIYSISILELQLVFSPAGGCHGAYLNSMETIKLQQQWPSSLTHIRGKVYLHEICWCTIFTYSLHVLWKEWRTPSILHVTVNLFLQDIQLYAKLLHLHGSFQHVKQLLGKKSLTQPSAATGIWSPYTRQ